MDVNVNIEGLGTASETISALFDSVDAALKKAELAGTAAIDACGGTGTRVGAAINDSFVAVNTDGFKKARTSVQNMIDNVGLLHTTYATEEEDIINAINVYKNGAQ